MNEINPVNGVPSIVPTTRLGGASAGAEVEAGSGPAEDLVEISDVAQMMSKLRSLPEIRQDVVNQIRGEIEAGTFETPERIEGTVEILLDELSDSARR